MIMKNVLTYSTTLFIFLLSLYSCEEVLFEEDLSDKAITLVAPREGSTVRNTSVTFSWNAVELATDYRVQVAQPDFENASQIVLDTVVSKTNFTTNLVKNEYEWRVRAQNSGSATPYVQAGFTVVESEDFSSREVLLISPQNDAVTNTTSITLQWQEVTDATSYRVELLNASNEVITEETTASTSISIDFPEGVTRWQVRAENATQNTLFTTRSLTVDTMVPNKPVNTTPANDATLTDTTVSFGWTRAAVTGTAEFDSIYVYNDVALTQLVNKDRVTSPSEISLDASTTYYWLIKAFDEAGNESESSDVTRFSIN